MKNSTFSAQVANNLLTLLQGYSKTIRLLLVMFLTLTVTTNAWGATITINGSASGITTTDGNQTITVDGITFKGKFKQYSTTALWFTSGSGYIYNTTSLGTINSITINYKSGGSASSKQYFTSGNSAITSYQSGTPQITTSTGGGSGTHSSFSGGFFNISISNKNLQATSIVIDYTPAGGGGSTPTQLAAPTGLNVTNITSTSATLSWDEVANASSYLVTIVDAGDLSADIPNTQTSHTFEGLTPSTEYLWTVTAVGDGINYTNSEESETGEFTTSAAGGGGGEGECSWVETAISSIKSTDIVVITMTTSGGTTYAMSNNNGTSAPAATTVTVSGSTLTSDIADNLKWNITNNAGSLTIYPNGTTSTWLYCTNSNNGVKVGTGTANEFTINDGYLYTSQTTDARYVGVYTTNPDWRCYTSTTGNIANQTLKFYVYKCDGGSGDEPTPTQLTKPTNLKVSDVTTTTATLSWDAVANANGYTVVVGSTSHNTNTTSITVEDLTASTTYKWSVTAKGNGSTYTDSDAANGSDFTTATPAPTNYTVTLNPNYPAGKTGTFKDKEEHTVNGNLEISLPANTESQTIASLYSSISLEGYIFEGWYEAADGNSKRTNTGDITKDITFYAHWKVPYTVTFNAGTGNCATESITETTANGITLPTATLTDCGDWTFLGWAETAIESETTTAPASFLAGGSTYKPTSDITLYAIYKRVEGGGGGEGTEATLTFDNTSKRTAFTTTQQVWTENGITLTNNKASSTSNVADYSNPARFYAKSEIIISAPANINKIVANCNKGASDLVSSVGAEASNSNNAVTIIPTSSNTTFTIAQLSAQVQMSSITVTYGGGLSTSYYYSNPVCGSTPTLTVNPTSLAFGNVTVNSNKEMTFTLTGSDLTANAALALSGTNESMFSVNPTSVTQSAGSIDQTITVTYAPTAAGNHTATLTISSTDAESKTVTLSGVGSNPPTWRPATINFEGIIQVACGSTTVLNPADPNNGPATITFNGYDLQNSVTVTASQGFLVSTNKTEENTYKQEVTVNPYKDGQNIGKIQNVYVIAQAPAQSGNYDGTITLTGADITNGSQVINVTAAVTCTQYTITWSVSGDTEMIEPTTFYAGGEWDLPENPDDFDCNGREFVGWTTSEIIGETPNAPAELYKSKGNFPEINEDKVFYAVFATSSGNDSDNATVSVSIENYAETNSWTDAKRYNTINISSHITATATGETNTGKYYENGKNWRLYQTESPTLTFNAQDGYNILSITIVYTVSNTGILTFNGSDITSDTPCEINASSAEFGVGNTSDATNGQVRITSISVTYSGGGGGYSGYATNCNPCDNSNFTISESNFTISKDSTLNLGALIQTENQSTIIYTCNTPNGTITDNGLFSATESGTYTVIIHQDSDNQDHCAVNKTITIKVVGEIVTLKWSVNGATNTNLSPGTVEKNTPIGTLPVPKTGCDDKTFMGWTTTSTVNNDGSDIEYIKPTTAPTENTTYYAVFASEGNQNSGDLEAIFYESFNKINGQGGNDEQWNATDNQKVGAGTDAIDSLITNHSWNITKGYEAYQCVKMGASSAQGIITTPAINQLNGDAVLTFRAGAWDNGGEELDIIVEVSGGATISPSAFTLKKAQFDTYTANITGGSSETKITIKAKEATKNRFFIDDIRIAAGTISFEDYTTRCGTYTVTYHGFGGYSTICGDNPAEKVVEVGSTFTVATCTPEDPKGLGRIFAGEWYTNPNGRGDTYKPGDSFVVEEDVVLYAKWTLNTNTAPLPVDDENKDLATTDIVVTGGTTLTLQAGTTTINSLTLKGGLQDNGSYAMPVVNIPTGATLVRNNNKINLDLKVNNKSYYPFAVPFEVANTSANVNYINTTLKEYANANNGYGKYYRILEYNGAGRADNGVHEDNWVHVGRTDVKLMPGKGYAISAVPASGQDTVTIRITMTVDNAWLADGEQESITVKEQTTTRNKVTVTAHTGPATDINNGGHQRHAGWNFVANPYLSKFAGNNVVNDVEYIKGSINIQNKYTYEDTEVTYVTIPAYNFAYYDQVELSEAALSPAYSFFVQVGTGGTMTFETAGRQQAPASIAARNAEERPVKMDVDITLSDNHSSDQTGIIISDRYSDAYEIGRDLEKLFGSAYNLSVYTLMADNTPLAFQALAIRSNMQVIPVGYRTPAQGEYTFRLNEATSSIDLLNEQYEQLVLVDYQTGELTNLLIADYTFYSERTQADNRFAIYAVPRQNAPTDLPNAIGQDKQAQKILHNGHLYILRDGNVYNGNGQIVK